MPNIPAYQETQWFEYVPHAHHTIINTLEGVTIGTILHITNEKWKSRDFVVETIEWIRKEEWSDEGVTPHSGKLHGESWFFDPHAKRHKTFLRNTFPLESFQRNHLHAIRMKLSRWRHEYYLIFHHGVFLLLPANTLVDHLDKMRVVAISRSGTRGTIWMISKRLRDALVH